MSHSAFTSGVNTVSEWFVKLAVLNILWILFTMAGFIILGWGPATSAVFSILRKWFLFGEEVPMYKTFKLEFKKEFKRANIIGFLIVSGIVSFYFSSLTILQIGQWQYLLVGVLLLALTLFSMFIIFIFPVFTHFNTTLRQSIQFALTLGFAYLHYYFIIAISFILIYMLYMALPGIMLFYFISIPAAVCMHFSARIFTLVEEREQLI